MTHRRTHPTAFMFLIIPFGVMSGYLSVAVAYLLSQAGVSVGQIAALIAVAFLPHTWKFLWAPIVDVTLTRRTWYLIASVLSAVGIWATGILPAQASSLPLLGVIVVVSNVAVTFLAMSVEGLMAYGTPEDEKGNAGGWFQAGYLGGAGLGGGAGLWLAQHLAAPWMAGAVLGLACLMCALALPLVHEQAPPPREGGVGASLKTLVHDIWGVARARAGFLAMVMCFLPVGSGAASGLWSAVARDWHASANIVAVVTGVMGGILSALGCLLGGFISDRMPRLRAYVIYGVLQALCALAMALAPRTETTYVLFTSIYAVITGLTYSGFTAFVLEAIGHGAAATKYNIYASLSNFPIYYMTRVEGWAYGRWGPGGMLGADTIAGIVGAILFLTVAVLASRRRMA